MLKDIVMGRTYRYTPRTYRTDPRFGERVKVVDYVTGERGIIYALELHDGVKIRCKAADLSDLRPSNPAIDSLIDSWDHGDPWGSGVLALSAVCDVLEAMGEGGRVDPGAGYAPAKVATHPTLEEMAENADDDFQSDASWLAESVLDGDVTEEDLARASRILSLYLDLVRAAGKDY